MNELDELLEIVDENNHVIGIKTRGEIYQKGLLHRAVNVILLNSEHQIFLQQRSEQKTKFPLCWDLSVGEHIKVGESFEDGAKRGLQEELGIDAQVFKLRGIHPFISQSQGKEFTITDNELVELFYAYSDDQIKLGVEEVKAGNFLTFDDIETLIKKDPHIFTPWLLDEWQFLSKNKELMKIA